MLKTLGRTIRWTAAATLALTATAGAADVEFMNWTYSEETGKAAIQKMIDDFAAAEGLEVEPQGYAWGDMSKNLFLRARSNALPDVTQIQGRLLPTFASIDAMVDLNTVFGAEALAEMFPAGFLAMGEVDGKQLAVPWIGGTIGMVANQAVLDKAGVDAIPMTISEFRDALVKVRDAVPNSVPYAMATKNNNSIVLDYLIWTWAFGGDVVDADGKVVVDSDAGREAMRFMVGLLEDRLASPEIDRPDARRLFAQGESAFYIDAPVARTFARQFSGEGEAYDVNVVPMKTPVATDGDTPVSIQWGHVIAIFGDGDVAADSPSAKWIMHLLSNEQLVDYAADQSALPTTKAGLASDRITNDAYLTAWADASVAPRRNTIASLSNGGEVANIIGEEVQAAILGQKSADDAVTALQARLEESMAKAN